MNIVRRLGLFALDIDRAAMSAIVNIQDHTGLYRRIFEAAGFSAEWSSAAHNHYIATMRYGIDTQLDIFRRFMTGEKSARSAFDEYVEWYGTHIERSFSFPKVK